MHYLKNTVISFLDVFMKQTKKGWDHEVYLFLGSEDEKFLKWGTKPHKMNRRIAYTDITDIRMVDMNGKPMFK